MAAAIPYWAWLLGTEAIAANADPELRKKYGILGAPAGAIIEAAKPLGQGAQALGQADVPSRIAQKGMGALFGEQAFPDPGSVLGKFKALSAVGGGGGPAPAPLPAQEPPPQAPTPMDLAFLTQALGAPTPIQAPLGFSPIGLSTPKEGWDFSGVEKAFAKAEEERAAAAQRMEAQRPVGEERPKDEQLYRFIQGLSGGAAAAGESPWNVGRILAAAGAGGLGELGALGAETRQEGERLRREQSIFDRDVAQMQAVAAEARLRDAVTLENAKMQDFQRRSALAMDEYQAKLGARSIYYDPSSGMAILTDKATGEVKTQQVSDIPLQLARMKMVKALGGSTVDMYNSAGKKFELDPVQEPAMAFAHLVANGYSALPLEDLDKAILEKMKANDPDGFNMFQAALSSNDPQAVNRLQQLRTGEAFNMAINLISSGRGNEVANALEMVHQTNLAPIEQMIVQQRRSSISPQR